MAPGRKAAGGKRGREAVEVADAAAAAPEAKLAKRNDEELRPVVEAIQAAAEQQFPESCRAMLLSFVPLCLDTPRDARDGLQGMAVELLGKFFESRRADMKKAIEEESAKLVEWEAGAGDLDAKVATARQELAERGEARHEEKKKELAAASQAMIASKAAASQAKEAQKTGDASYEDAVAEKIGVEAVMAAFPALKEGQWEEKQAQEQIDGMMPLAKKLKLDASLVSAMPSSLIKAPSVRGPFDQMVIQQLEEILQAKAKSLEEHIEAEGPAVQARAAALEAAQKAAEEAKQRQQQVASEVFEAQAVVKDLQAALDEAEAAKESYGPKFKAATQVRDRKTKELEVFETVSLVCFEKLRDRTTITEAAAAPAADAPTPSKAVVEQGNSGVQVAVGGQ